MPWERIHHWQWLIIAVILGVTVAMIRQSSVDDAIHSYGESLNGQRKFEEALLRTIQGHRQFENVLVTPEMIEDPRGAGGPAKFVHVVRGSYWDGRRELKDGVEQANLRPAFFVASVPYRPIFDLNTLGDKGKEAAQKFATITNPTVVDFLAAVDHASGINYSYAWWRGSAYAMWLWIAGCVVVFGIAIPLVINLKVYGTIWRPGIVKEDAIDLSNVKPTPPPVAKPTVTDEDLAKLAELEKQIESELSTNAIPKSPTAAASPAAVRKLSNAALEAAAQAEQEEKAYAAKADDFYPTERRAKH